MKAGILQVFKDRVPPDTHRAVVGAFDGELVVDTGEDVTDDAYVALIDRVPALKAPVDALISEEEAASSPAMVASACEMVLEGLHLAKRLNKDAVGGRAQFRSRAEPDRVHTDQSAKVSAAALRARPRLSRPRGRAKPSFQS